jgi:HTH-type transcriptional regulator/antitoxin HipB
MNYKEFKQKILSESSVARNEYLRRDLALDVANLIIRGRVNKGLTQKQLSLLIGTKQSGISRAERGGSLPSMSLLDKIAKALGLELFVEFRDTTTTAANGWMESNREKFIQSPIQVHSNIANFGDDQSTRYTADSIYKPLENYKSFRN